jgi:hypothetical protein
MHRLLILDWDSWHRQFLWADHIPEPDNGQQPYMAFHGMDGPTWEAAMRKFRCIR